MASQEEADCLPQELAEAIFGIRRPESGLWTGSLPPEVRAEFSLPKGVRIIGSTSDPEHQQVFASSSLEPAEILKFYDEHFAAIAWTKPLQSHRDSGFIEKDQPIQSIYCGPDTQTGYLLTRKRSTDTLLNLALSQYAENIYCPTLPPSPIQKIRIELEERMPALTPPVRVFGHQGVWSSEDSLGNSIILTSDYTMDEVQAHFSAQLEDQDWTSDTLAIGALGQDSLWHRRFDDGIQFLGHLLLIDQKPGTIKASFEITQLAR
jgi:hypothetical protein